jgi:hypothetical protein
VTLACYPTSKIASENVEVFANSWAVQINDLSVLVKDVNDVCHGKSDRQVYLSLPRPGVSIDVYLSLPRPGVSIDVYLSLPRPGVSIDVYLAWSEY